jgi:hypothetical protein
VARAVAEYAERRRGEDVRDEDVQHAVCEASLDRGSCTGTDSVQQLWLDRS